MSLLGDPSARFSDDHKSSGVEPVARPMVPSIGPNPVGVVKCEHTSGQLAAPELDASKS
jgi:hypothetical protein